MQVVKVKNGDLGDTYEFFDDITKSGGYKTLNAHINQLLQSKFHLNQMRGKGFYSNLVKKIKER